MYEKQLAKSMKKVRTLKHPKKLSNSQLRNLKRQALAQANRQPNPLRRNPANPLAVAIQQQNQLAKHQQRVANRQASRAPFRFQVDA